MPINLFWDDDEKTIIRVVFEPDWTWEEYNQGLDDTREMVKGITHTYHEIIDMRQTHKLPHASPIQYLLKGRQQGSSHIGLIIIVGAPKMIEIFVDVFKKAYGTRFPQRLMVETLEDAYQLIADYAPEPSDN